MKLNKIQKGTYHLMFNSISDINNTLIRFTAPNFSKDKLEDWYVNNYLKNKEKHPMAGGFLDAKEIEMFFYENKNNLLEKEKEFYQKIKNKKFKYIVTTSYESIDGTLEHEVAHVLYNSNNEYKSRAVTLIDKINEKTKRQIKRLFKIHGYDDSLETFYDEAQACIVGQPKMIKLLGVNFYNSNDIIEKLEKNF